MEIAGWRVLSEQLVSVPNSDAFMAARAMLLSGEDLRSTSTSAGDRRSMNEMLEGILSNYVAIQRGLRVKTFSKGRLEMHEWQDDHQQFQMTWRVCDSDGRVHKEWTPQYAQTQWLDIDHRGRIIFGEKGCLWAWEGFPDGEPKLIADLNANKFEPIEAPAWAKEW
jgi:hypothetical protein